MRVIFCRSLLILTLLFGFLKFSVAEEDVIDFSTQMTPVCELAGLRGWPPEGWINVPINTGIEQLTGCQMMLIVDQTLIGVLRVLSFDWSNAPADLPPWPEHVMTVESILIAEMGYKIVEPIWHRETVPINGPGFGNGQAMGFALEIEGNSNPQESHMLVFDRGDFKYLINLLTPAKSVNDGQFYERNLSGMGNLMQSFKVSEGKPQ